MGTPSSAVILTLFIVGVLSAQDVRSVKHNAEKSSITTGMHNLERKQLLQEVEHLRRVKDSLRISNNSTPNYRPTDCADLYISGARQSGVYDIYPFTCICTNPIRVYCDMDTAGGGWTILLSRQSQIPQISFNRSWSEYKAGFGWVNGEHYLGNENIHHITSGRDYYVRFDWITSLGFEGHITYNSFKIDDESSRYNLRMGTVKESTTARDCYHYNKNKYFSTYDRDSDSSSSNLAQITGAGFWFYNGYLTYPPTHQFIDGYMNMTCNSYRYGVDRVSKFQIKLRPAICNTAVSTIDTFTSGCNPICANP